MRSPAEYVGRPVASLQTMLRVIAAQDDRIPTPIPDGFYGTRTMRAVTAFQRCAGLPPTGVTDYATWKAVAAAYEELRPDAAPPAPLALEMPDGPGLCEGSCNLHVLLIQAMLHTLSKFYVNLSDCPLCGEYNAETAAAVKALQCACGMAQTGVLDKRCWARLAALYAQATGDGTQPPASKAEEPPEKPAAAAPEPPAVQVHADPVLAALS